MKKVLLTMTVLLSISMVSCKNSEKNSEAIENNESNSTKLMQNTLPSYAGEYFYSNDGAVLKGTHFIYAVTMDDMAKELGDKIAPIKKEEYDMVPVVVKGVVEVNPAYERGEKVWEQIITIKEIVSVSDAPAEIDIKIEEKKS
ncbi:hypothetical protein KXJ69_03195 [Aureisphaera sp. CAU 1614]|uniref:NlpE C-terminal OB domain-containing protein n=1 Tax=Halomarinibacterium sedimenti TaxID=2857106 RepID=A0A9X1FMK9_9FLAO|nr:hypothetical protein [Halomarinibacterium sedimenti]MBW2937095.1 hypothetical protein [Halomarinibacterium sedimenti]